MTEIYLDNAATTQAYDSVGEVVKEVLCTDYGNPSSLHIKGVEGEQYVRDARETLAHLLKVQEKEIYFTSGGTESDNLALMGVAHAYQRTGKHLITSCVEHPAVLNTMRHLEEEGFEVTYLPVDHEGKVQLDALKEALRPDTTLVSIMYLNNEVGAVQPIAEAARLVKEYNPGIIFHTDAVQGFGKYQIYPKRLGVDLCSISGHKIHGPKGVGALYIDSGVKIRPILFGGGQQRDIRPGTENVPGIAGLAEAARITYTDLDEKVAQMRRLKGQLEEGLLSLPDVQIHGRIDEDSAPNILSVGFAGIRSEVLLHALEDRGIYVSSGSACSSNHPGVSGVLQGMGVEQKYLESTLRFSLSEFTTEEEIDETVMALQELVPMLRRYTRH